MSGEITFLPWLRRGLAQALAPAASVYDALPRSTTIPAWVAVEGTQVDRPVVLQGPDAVTGVAAAQVLREEPRRDSTEAEPFYFPFVELAAPGLPWMFTPAGADGQGRLRPWLVLVAVREPDGATLEPGRGGALPVLRVEDPAAELPDLEDSWAWVHVESLVGADGVADAVSGGTGGVVARVMCPRRLLPDSSWLACLVPAFDGGRARGLGEELPAGGELLPAWTQGGEPVELPVYHHWRFTTGAPVTFESLCRRLKPDGDGAELGLYPLDVTDPGIVRPAAKRVLLDMEGALKTAEAVPRDWDATHKADFQGDIAIAVDAGAARPAPMAKEPVVAPPLYGGRPADMTAVPAAGWVRTLNAHPVRRAAAGLGAGAVRAAQEELVAAAWDQAGDLKAAMTALSRARLGTEVGRTLARRAGTLADGDLVQLTAPLQAFLRSGGSSIRATLAASDVPDGLVSAAYVRQTRPGAPLARDWAARTGSPARLATEHTRINLEATAAGGKRAVLEFAVPGVPAGAWTEDPALSLSSEPPAARAPTAATVRALARRGRRLPKAQVQRPTSARALRVDAGTDVSDIAASVRAVLDPLAPVRSNVLARVPALAPLVGAGELPTRVPIGPVFTDPLYWDLLGIGSHWVLPGGEAMRRNRVRLVETDKNFVGAFLIGANHELGRELLWRGYPVDLRATFFHRFWDYVDATKTDISDLHGWDHEDTIAGNMGGPGTDMTAIVIRGDVVRRYPTLRCYLIQAEVAGGSAEVVEGTEVEPDFLGTLDRDTLFVGFSGLTSDAVRAGYFVVVEEQMGAPRFGLDKATKDDFTGEPRTWNGLSWGHLVHDQAELDALTHARAGDGRLAGFELGGTTWGFNAAHQARATWQRPFRMYIHAELLV